MSRYASHRYRPDWARRAQTLSAATIGLLLAMAGVITLGYVLDSPLVTMAAALPAMGMMITAVGANLAHRRAQEGGDGRG